MNLHPAIQIANAAVQEAQTVAYYRKISMMMSHAAVTGILNGLDSRGILPNTQFITPNTVISTQDHSERAKSKLAAEMEVVVGGLTGPNQAEQTIYSYKEGGYHVEDLQKTLPPEGSVHSARIVRDIDIRVDQHTAQAVRLVFGFSSTESDIPTAVDFVSQAIDQNIKRLKTAGEIY